MKNEEILKVEDRSKIDKVIFNYPELMSSGAEDTIKKMYMEMTSLDAELQQARVKVRDLENAVKEAKEKWNSIQNLFTYTHPINEKVYVTESCTFAIQGHGNDIIGKTTVM